MMPLEAVAGAPYGTPTNQQPNAIMSDDIITILTTFDEPVSDTPENLLQLQNVFSNTVLQAWEKEGFTEIKPLDKPAHKGDLCPAYRAVHGGKPCLILMPPPAPDPMQLDGLSDAQCVRAETKFPELDVFYSSVLLWGTELVLFLPEKLRENGEWLASDAQSEQFLPASRWKGGSNVLPSIMGCGYFFKGIQLLMPYLIKNGTPAKFIVGNLTLSPKPDGAYIALMCSRTPCWAQLLAVNSGDKRLEAHHVVLYHDKGPYTELELVEMSDEFRMYGITRLLHQSGHELSVECLEASVLANLLPTGRRYMWSLYTVAEKVLPNNQHFSITEGPVFEMHKEQYREEHGEEPPADFKLEISTEGMRAVNQNCEGEEAAFSSCFGVVTHLEKQVFSPLEVPGGACLKATVRCMPDDDDFLMTVYMPPVSLDGYTPKVGDSIAFHGTLFAVPDKLCETKESWQDSAEVGGRQGEHENTMKAYCAMERFQERSIGLGVAAAAFVKAGWSLEYTAEDDLFSRSAIPLMVKNQRGEIAVVNVDTIVDGHEPRFAYTEKRADIESFVRENDDIDRCYWCRVHLDYKPAADRYAVSMEMEPACAGVENSLLMTAAGFRGTDSVMEDGEIKERPTRPAVLDEAMAARLFQDAMAKGEWAALAKWMREEMTYRSHTAGVEFYGKIDFLRHMAERVEGWKRLGVWKDFAFSRGTVTYQGRERACVGSYHQGKLTNTTIFGDKLGMVGHMETLPREYCELYHEETPPVAPDEA